MDIKAQVVKAVAKEAVKGWRGWAEKARQWFTRGARKRQGREIVTKYAIVVLALAGLTGCQRLDMLAIRADDALYNSSTAQVAVPEGHELRPYVTDAADNRQNIDGWKVKYEIVPVPGHVHEQVKDVVMRGRKPKLSAVGEVIQAGMTVAGIGPEASPTPATSGAQAAAERMAAEAAKEGIMP